MNAVFATLTKPSARSVDAGGMAEHRGGSEHYGVTAPGDEGETGTGRDGGGDQTEDGSAERDDAACYQLSQWIR